MNTEREPTEDAKQSAAANPGMNSLSAAAAERRRLLLKGIGRGGAVVAAAIPLNSFATLNTQRLYILPVGLTGKNKCSVSGQHSGFHSGGPGSSDAPCGGRGVSFWCDPTVTWPSGCDKTAACTSVFSGCSLTVPTGNPWPFPTRRAATLAEVLTKYPDSDDAHWVCAWLNSCGPSALNFPYETREVMSLYGDSTTRLAALTFFKTYTEK